MITMNPMLIFIDECCDLGEGQKVLSTTLWGAYRDWCKDCNYTYKPLSRNNFFETILTTFPEVRKEEDERQHQTFFGISVRGLPA
ncbi:MAG: hypothetical protein JW950_06220 [Deltaproteobacteria bacterium]|nr:hypothetical protein [Deltaproteobacteria bacterium]